MPAGINQVAAECQVVPDACGTASLITRPTARLPCSSTGSRRSARAGRSSRTGPCSRARKVSEMVSTVKMQDDSIAACMPGMAGLTIGSHRGGSAEVDDGKVVISITTEIMERPAKTLKCASEPKLVFAQQPSSIPVPVASDATRVASAPQAIAASQQAQKVPSVPDEKVIAVGFENLIAIRVSMTKDLQESSIFHAKAAPKMSIHDYISRIRKHIECSEACFILSLVYMDRVSKKASLSRRSCHRLLLAGLVLACKFHDDEDEVHYNNMYWAKVGGIGVRELYNLEARFLELLNWRLFVSEAEYERYRQLVYSAASRSFLALEN